MKILILEDNSFRIEKFKILFKNQQVDLCYTAEEAIYSCRKNKYEILWLDHDLDGKIWQDSQDENTGFRFIKWMVDNKIEKDALIYIHSMNPVGANKMLNYLKDNDYDGIWIPFNLLKLEN